MTADDHVDESERLLEIADPDEITTTEVQILLSRAQVHATLALQARIAHVTFTNPASDGTAGSLQMQADVLLNDRQLDRITDR